MEQPTLYEELGGEPALKQIIDRFIDRVVSDRMIGFHFNGVDRDVLKKREFEFAAQHLGANIQYTGRPLEEAHKKKHHIFDGQFLRRLAILKETLAELQAPPRVVDHWVAHTESLRDRIIRGPCDEQNPS